MFSHKYDKAKLGPYLLQTKILFVTIKDLPVLPNLASQIEEELVRRSIFGTAAIEGNPLSEEVVNKLLTEDDKKRGLEKAAKQIRNLKNAYALIREMRPSNQPFLLEEAFIKKLQSIITHESEENRNVPGNYRNEPVKVGDEAHGGVYTPPKCLDDVKDLMKEFLLWINSPDLLTEDPVIRAAMAHYYFGRIHPFSDGNGRTARVIEALLLKRSGFRFVYNMLSNFYYKNLDEYFWAFSLSEKNEEGDVTPFLEFFLKALVASLNEIRDRVFFLVRKFTLRDYYVFCRKGKTLSQRQYDLLCILLETGKTLALKELYDDEHFRVLYRGVSERTAYRDLKWLAEENFLKMDAASSRYELNWHVVD